MRTILSTIDWAHLQEVFDAAMGLRGEERTAYLDEACQAFPGLRTRVESLIAAIDQETSVGGVVSAAATSAADIDLPVTGGILGHYRIAGVIGRGGMGIVYRAVRADDEFKKEVAIKVATMGLLAPDLRRRFLDERQILANLDHPNIARLLDGGTTPEGIPFVVMELVEGQPIDAYCTSHELGLRQRIDLMITVARSVDYAHRHLVVHRDLKPENVHVASDGTPKLLDFGIAKALSPEAVGGEGNVTLDAARLMTPEYASPEQVLGRPITTATDVYQLGVLLFVLLTGRRPFQAAGSSLGELEKNICETPPPHPGIDADIDRVILQALAKDPRRRYSSAEALAEDLERYLAGYPVQARSTSAAYRTFKFVNRHRLGVLAAGVVLFLILAFTATMALLAKRLEQQRNRAQLQLERSERISQLLEAVFVGADPDSARGTNPTARQLLDRASTEVSQTLTREPEVQARLFSTLGHVYESLGAYGPSEDLLKRSLAIRRHVFGENSTEAATGLYDMAALIDQEGHNTQAEGMAREALTLRESLAGPRSLETAQALNILGEIEMNEGNAPEAERLYKRSIAILEQLPRPSNLDLTHVLSNYSHLLQDQGHFAEAEVQARRMLAIASSTLGEDHPETAQAMTVLGELLNVIGKYDEAETLFRKSVALRRKLLGSRHNSLGATEGDLASLLEDKGEFDEAERLYADALSIQSEALGPESRVVAIDKNNLASLYEDRGDYARAEPLFRDSLAIRKKLLAPDSPLVARAEGNLGKLLVERGKLQEAKELLDSALAIREKKYGEKHPETAASYLVIGKLQIAEHQKRHAERTLRHSLELYRASVRAGHPSIAKTLEVLAGLLLSEGRRREAAPLLVEATSIRRSTLPPGSPKIRAVEQMLTEARSAS